MNKVKNLLKTNKKIYKIYFNVFSTLLKCISFFIPHDDKLILFVSYGGRRYDDSPKIFYEYLQKQSAYKNFNMVWAFEKPNKFPGFLKKVNINSVRYFYFAMRAKYWITNSSVERGLIFKKNQIYVNFQHGTAGIKLLGRSLPENNVSMRYDKSEDFDFIFVQGKIEIQWLCRDWAIDSDRFYLTGLPRTLELINNSTDVINTLKVKYQIDTEKKVILYAPTFREYNINKNREIFSKNPFDFETIKNSLGEQYIWIMTSHYAVDTYDIKSNNGFVKCIMDPSNFNELVLLADIIVTDYSSVTFDGFAADKPVLCFAYDYDEYMESRGGTYLNLNTLFSHGVIKNQKDLIDIINNFDFEKEINFSKSQKNKYLYIDKNVNKECERLIFKQ